MTTPLRWMLCALAGLFLTLLSTFAGERMATAVYPDVMGCETGCAVVATGWPLVFVRDYKGMSVVNSADILEVWIGADRFDGLPFVFNVIFWTALLGLLGWWRRAQVQSER